MKIEELNKQYGHDGHQCGNKIIYKTNTHVHGYVIAGYDTATHLPTHVYTHMHDKAPLTPKIETWDDAHDAIFGKPGAPKFGANLLNI